MDTSRPPRVVVRLLTAAVALLGLAGEARAQIQPDLSEISIEDLMQIEITTASRRGQPAADAAAAVFVITQDDIRRSGMRTIPDLLRLAPGVHVAQVTANKWAVSVRGFNGLYANKLLVLVDGRSVYNRLFSGVIWFDQDLMIDDIDRIEVIRGPGGTMWGANAVNGVINIVTRTAAESQGALVRVDAGSLGTQAAVRYGGTKGRLQYRAFAQYTDVAETLVGRDVRANDGARSVTTGVRADFSEGADAFALRVGLTGADINTMSLNLNPSTSATFPVSDDRGETRGAYVFGSWTRTGANGAALQVQMTLDGTNRHEPIGEYARRLWDTDVQYRFAASGRHELMAGGGYRFMRERLDGRTGVSLTPARDDASLVTGFVQDEIGFRDKRLVVTLGAQIQYDSDWGTGVLPSARGLWKVSPNQRLWTAWSRARRTPSLTERGIGITYPPVFDGDAPPVVVSVVGNPDPLSEQLSNIEAGYRIGIGSVASVDITAYMARYRHLVTQESSAPVFEPLPFPRIRIATQSGNALDAAARGVELAGSWTPSPAWRLVGSYTGFHLSPRLRAGSSDPAAADADGTAPRSQWQIRSVTALGRDVTVSAALFRVGSLRVRGIDAYTRGDLNLEWRPSRQLSIMVFGQNLLEPAHYEFSALESLTQATQVPRRVGVRLRWASR